MRWLAVPLAVALVLACACHRARPADAPLRLGYFANITHAQALAGAADGSFERALGGGKLELKPFSAGPPAMEALLAGDIDVTYVGAAPAILVYVRSSGRARVISGAARGGAALVVRDPGITAAAQLQGKKIASPQIGNTQDVSLRHWLKSQGIDASDGPGRQLQILPLANAECFGLFKEGRLDAAWVPEPWVTRLLHEAGGHILVDDRDTPTTLIVASAEALRTRRDQIAAIVRANRELTARVKVDPDGFRAAANQGFEKVAGRKLSDSVLAEAFSRITFTTDPMAE